MYLGEEKFQNWQAVAILKGGTEALLCLGRSSAQIRRDYVIACLDGLSSDDQQRTVEIELRQWQGTPDRGKWKAIDPLRHPHTLKDFAQMSNGEPVAVAMD